MSLEQDFSALNSRFFFREFSFARGNFKPSQDSELEFADNVVLLDDLLISYQLKERGTTKEIITPKTESQWFKNKVLKKAIKQVRDTIRYLSNYDEIVLTNNKGHGFNVKSRNIARQFHIVVYLPTPLLPKEHQKQKCYQSSEAGFIHIFSRIDYAELLNVLVTPAEIAEYLNFRERLCLGYFNLVEELEEQALLGQFLKGHYAEAPHSSFSQYVDSLSRKFYRFDMLPFFKMFADQITYSDNPYDYYRIIQEVAKLNRSELEGFKALYSNGIEKAGKGEFVRPACAVFPRTDCGFVFVVIPPEDIINTLVFLKNFTDAHKYNQKLGKCIGVSFSKANEFYDIGWCYKDHDWAYNTELEEKLRIAYPFGDMVDVQNSRYAFTG